MKAVVSSITLAMRLRVPGPRPRICSQKKLRVVAASRHGQGLCHSLWSGTVGLKKECWHLGNRKERFSGAKAERRLVLEKDGNDR